MDPDILSHSSMPAFEACAYLLIQLEVVSESEEDEIFAASFVYIVETMPGRRGVE